jgi:hypothetical protein
MLTSLPGHFHTPIYERVMLLLKQHPLLAPTPMNEEVPHTFLPTTLIVMRHDN